VPPGLSTRVISSTYFFLSGICSPLSHAHTKSKLLSSNFILNASITSKLTLESPLNEKELSGQLHGNAAATAEDLTRQTKKTLAGLLVHDARRRFMWLRHGRFNILRVHGQAVAARQCLCRHDAHVQQNDVGIQYREPGEDLSSANSVPRFTCSGERVIPRTVAFWNLLASALLVPPKPHPTSRMDFGSELPDHLSIASTKSYFAYKSGWLHDRQRVDMVHTITRSWMAHRDRADRQVELLTCLKSFLPHAKNPGCLSSSV
jgi:hypothetical protein